MKKQTLRYYKQFKAERPAHVVGQFSANCLQYAKILQVFDDLGDSVRIQCEPEEENYYDVYGIPESDKEKRQLAESLEKGCWYVFSEYKCPCCGQWNRADGIGMCVGYNDPCLPFENNYVIDLMDSAVKQFNIHS